MQFASLLLGLCITFSPPDDVGGRIRTLAKKTTSRAAARELSALAIDGTLAFRYRGDAASNIPRFRPDEEEDESNR